MTLLDRVTEAIFADIALPDAPWVDEWKARAPKAAIAVVLKDLDCAAYYSDEPSPHDQFTTLQQILFQKAASTIERQAAELMEAKELIRQILDDRLDNDADIGEWKEKANKLLALREQSLKETDRIVGATNSGTATATDSSPDGGKE